MGHFVVSGLINLETTLAIEGFPLDYFPVRYPFFGIASGVSGVGFNLSRALHALGDSVDFLSLIGDDAPGELIRQTLRASGLDDRGVLSRLAQTPQSVILYEPSGRRQCHTDLKDVQDQSYPLERFRKAAREADWALLTNLNPSRALLSEAQALGLPVATDVHAIGSLDDAYNQDFMRAAKVLFMSDERITEPPEDWLHQVQERFSPEIAVLGMGDRGALMAVKATGRIHHEPAVTTRPVVNTVGAGDALFASFMHAFQRHGDPVEALKRAVVFASYKVGESGGAQGFLDCEGLERFYRERAKEKTPPEGGAS